MGPSKCLYTRLSLIGSQLRMTAKLTCGLQMHYMTFLLAAILVATSAQAQTRGQGIIAAGPLWPGEGGARLALSFGGEQVGPQGLSGGAELVMLTRTIFSIGRPEGRSAKQFVVSGLIGGRALKRSRVVPFVSGGPSLVTNPDQCCGAGFGWTIGGGADYWVARHFGIRSEVRIVRAFRGEGSFSLIRVGIAVR